MNPTEVLHAIFTDLAVKLAHRPHREDYYTTAICAEAWPQLHNRILVATGLGLDPLREVLGSHEIDNLRARCLPETKDFYADLVLTEDQSSFTGNSFLALNDFSRALKITHLFEFKFLSSFPSLSRGIARADTFKLKVLREYVRITCGEFPHTEQVIFNLKRHDKPPKRLSTIMGWFTDPAFRADTDGVLISIIDDGNLHRIP